VTDDTTVLVEGAPAPEFALVVRSRMMEALDWVGARPTMAKVIFTDVNGAKGGVDTRCTIVAEIPLSVEEMGTTAALAFDAAVVALKHSVTREYERRRALARRPKKYFVAKRLLGPETTFDSPASPWITPVRGPGARAGARCREPAREAQSFVWRNLTSRGARNPERLPGSSSGSEHQKWGAPPSTTGRT